MWRMQKRSFRVRLPSKSESGRCENEAFVRDFDPSESESWSKMWKRSFRARLPSKSESGRCGNEAFVWECVRLPSKSESGRCGNEAFVWECVRLPSKSEKGRCENEAFSCVTSLKIVEDVRTTLSCETSLKIWKWKMRKRSFRARLFHQNLNVELKTTLSGETSLKKWKLKMRKRSFRASLLSNSESGRCENEAFVRDYSQKIRLGNFLPNN